MPFDPWSEVRGQIYLGSEEFVRDASARAASLTVDREIPRSQREAAPASPDEICALVLDALRTTHEELLAHPRKKARDRGLLAYALRRFAGATGNDLAALLGVSSWRASGLAREGERRWGEDGALRKRLEGALGTR